MKNIKIIPVLLAIIMFFYAELGYAGDRFYLRVPAGVRPEIMKVMSEFYRIKSDNCYREALRVLREVFPVFSLDNMEGFSARTGALRKREISGLSVSPTTGKMVYSDLANLTNGLPKYTSKAYYHIEELEEVSCSIFELTGDNKPDNIWVDNFIPIMGEGIYHIDGRLFTDKELSRCGMKKVVDEKGSPLKIKAFATGGRVISIPGPWVVPYIEENGKTHILSTFKDISKIAGTEITRKNLQQALLRLASTGKIKLKLASGLEFKGNGCYSFNPREGVLPELEGKSVYIPALDYYGAKDDGFPTRGGVGASAEVEREGYDIERDLRTDGGVCSANMIDMIKLFDRANLPELPKDSVYKEAWSGIRLSYNTYRLEAFASSRADAVSTSIFEKYICEVFGTEDVEEARGLYFNYLYKTLAKNIKASIKNNVIRKASSNTIINWGTFLEFIDNESIIKNKGSVEDRAFLLSWEFPLRCLANIYTNCYAPWETVKENNKVLLWDTKKRERLPFDNEYFYNVFMPEFFGQEADSAARYFKSLGNSSCYNFVNHLIEFSRDIDSLALKIDYHCNEDIDIPGDEIITAVRGYLQHFLDLDKGLLETEQLIGKNMDKDKIADKITDMFIGSRKTRLGSYPLRENIKDIEKRIIEGIEKKVPIEVVMTWAPKKHLVTGEENAVDLNELVALERLYDIHKNVQKIYAPGLHYTFYIEDLAGDFIEGRSGEIQESIRNYSGGMRQLVKVLGAEDVLTFVSTNEFAKEEGVYEEMLKRMDEIYTKIEAYWIESEEKGIQNYQDYESYKELQKLGWEGSIPQEMRDYYLERAYHLYHDTISLEEKKHMVMRDLTQVLVAAQFNMLRGQGEIAPLKFSFVRPAPGIPLSRMRARVDLRTVSVDVTKKSIPPWTGKGYLAFRKGKILPHMRSWREPIEDPDKMVKGVLTLSRGNEYVRIRADYLVLNSNITDEAIKDLKIVNRLSGNDVKEIDKALVELDKIAEFDHYRVARIVEKVFAGRGLRLIIEPNWIDIINIENGDIVGYRTFDDWNVAGPAALLFLHAEIDDKYSYLRGKRLFPLIYRWMPGRPEFSKYSGSEIISGTPVNASAARAMWRSGFKDIKIRYIFAYKDIERIEEIEEGKTYKVNARFPDVDASFFSMEEIQKLQTQL
ncbi:MAG: hypothetical protein WC312_05445 [Candidatus Omnitrophota bacterium]|jgi:hypothetical protein